MSKIKISFLASDDLLAINASKELQGKYGNYGLEEADVIGVKLDEDNRC